jgi:hypothetical protein
VTAPAGKGIPGFSGRDLPLAAGAVTGVRLWRVDRTAAGAAMSGAAVPGEGLLTGVFGGVWRHGENVAACGGGPAPPCPDDLVPAPGCGCGFWAYWAPRYAWRCDYYWRAEVIGAIQGYGRTRIGTRGCRCAKARILGLHVRPPDPGRPPSDGPSHHDLTGILASYYGVPCYPSLAQLLAARPLTADYLPRRHRHLATSPALRPEALTLPAPPTWLRGIGLAGQRRPP